MGRKLKKLWSNTKNFFSTPEIPEIGLGMKAGFPHIEEDPNERMHRENIENIGIAGLKLQRQAYQHQLAVMHRSMLVALFAAIVALVLGIIALVRQPSVTVKPSVIVKETSIR